jgi:hypothetical protein
LTARLHFVGSVEGVQVELGYDVQEEEDEVIFGQPVGRADNLLGISLGVPGAILLATGYDHDEPNSDQNRQETMRTENAFVQLQLPTAARIDDKK